MDVQGKTFVSQNEALQALTKLPDSARHHIEKRIDATGHESFAIVDNPPAVAKKGKAAASLAVGEAVKTVQAKAGAAGKLAEGAAKAVGTGIASAGKAQPSWFRPEYLGPIGILPGPLLLPPEARDKIKQMLKDFGEKLGPALRPQPLGLSPEAREKVLQEVREASKNLGPISALPGFQEKAREFGTKAKEAAKDMAETFGKALVFGPFLPGVLLGEAIAKKR